MIFPKSIEDGDSFTILNVLWGSRFHFLSASQVKKVAWSVNVALCVVGATSCEGEEEVLSVSICLQSSDGAC